MNPFFSVIVPTFNSETTLSVALDSVVGQTYKNIEVIIIDGLSTDNTIKISKKYVEQFNNVKVLSEKDKGIYDAMNKGISLSKGDWLYFMGSDDHFFSKDVLETIVKTIDKTSIDILYGNICSNTYGSKYDDEFTYEKLIKKNIGHQAIFFNKRVFNIIGIFSLKYKALADWDHNIRWFFSSKIKKKYIDIIIANYADGGYSMMNADNNFNKDKYKILFRYGFTKLKRNDLIKITLHLANNSKVGEQYFNYLFYRMVHILLSLINRIKL